MIIGLLKNYEMIMYNVDTAFLNADLDEFILIELPSGFGHPPGTIAHLNKAVY